MAGGASGVEETEQANLYGFGSLVMEQWRVVFGQSFPPTPTTICQLHPHRLQNSGLRVSADPSMGQIHPPFFFNCFIAFICVNGRSGGGERIICECQSVLTFTG